MLRHLTAYFIAAPIILCFVIYPVKGQVADPGKMTANAPLNLRGEAGKAPDSEVSDPPSTSSGEVAEEPSVADAETIASSPSSPSALPLRQSRPLPLPKLKDRPADSSSTALGTGMPESSSGGELWRVGVALFIVLAALYGFRRLIRRMGGITSGSGAMRPSGVMEILARYPVARGQQIILLKIARRVILVHQNGTAMSTLSEMTEKDEVADLLRRIEAGSQKSPAGGFRAVLDRFHTDHQVASRSSEINRGDYPGALNPQVIDLTRSHEHPFMRLLGRKGGAR